jgi:AAA+ ATPase superfamily predicted ATPase
MYGRRRVGKTTILQEFARNSKAIFFSGQEKNDALNLSAFSKLVQERLDGVYIAPFPAWGDAFHYVTQKAPKDNKLAVIIDEFPFIAKQNPAVKSSLQHI